MSILIALMTKISYIVTGSLACLFLRQTFATRGDSFLRRNGDGGLVVSDADVNLVYPSTEDIAPSVSIDNNTSTDGITSYTSEALADQVTDLPGLTFTPEFKQFSGYLQVSPTREIHYWYIESMNNPSTDPVVFWTNGGPGCSGLLGLGTEMGPFIFEDAGKLSLNPFTWNKIANIFYVEQPAGVGFSKFSDPDDADVGDERAAMDNFELIKAFFDRFPERKGNDFYVSSESFGGHYIPWLTKTILKYNEDKAINFKGFLVGNPYVDPFSNDVTMLQTYYMHGLIARPYFNMWEENCLDKNNYDEDQCNELVDIMMNGAGVKINPYALDFPACNEPDNNDYPPQQEEEDKEIAELSLENGILSTRISKASRKMMPSSQSTRLVQATAVRSPPFLPKVDVYHPCAESHLYHYLNRDDVKSALHVDVDKDWSMCTDDIHYDPDDRDKDQTPLYEDLIAFGKQSGSDIKMMVFSGDDDSICSTAGTQYWIWTIGAEPKTDMFWKPWQYNNQTAGYVTEFDLGNTSSTFHFVTVHGAGHEVPAYRPAEALSMFTSFFSGNWTIGKVDL